MRGRILCGKGNGQSWTPQGQRLTSNLSVDYDPSFKNGIFGIVAYNFIPINSEQLTLGIRDSLNFKKAPFTVNLGTNSLYGISFDKKCPLFSSDSSVSCSGNLSITKLDRVSRIIAGTFNATLSQTGCDTVKITEGRFDMKF